MVVTILGHVCIDHNVSENAAYTGAGGPAMFMHKVYAQFPKVESTIIAPHGQDFSPYSSDVRLLPSKSSDHPTLIYENKSQNTIRTQKAFHREHAGQVKLDTEVKSAIEGSDVMFLTPLLPNFTPEYVRSVMKLTPSNCLRVLLPQGYFREFDSRDNVIRREFIEAPELLPLFNVVIVSDQDYPNVDEISAEWTRKYGVIVIVTLGDKGCQIVKGDEKIHVPVEPVATEDIIDSVGSGDVFSASFAYHFALHHDLTKAATFANAIARECLFYTSDDITIDVDRFLK